MQLDRVDITSTYKWRALLSEYNDELSRLLFLRHELIIFTLKHVSYLSRSLLIKEDLKEKKS